MQKKSISDRIWGVFSSVKLAIVVFSLIALTSIIGTIIEQQVEPEKNLQVLSKLAGPDMAPTLYRILDSMGFMNMYRSWWFLSLLGLFALNLLVCSIDRFPAIWRLVRAPLKPIPENAFGSLPIKTEVIIKGDPNMALEKARKAMRSIGFKAKEGQDETGARQLFAQKSPWSRFGIYIAHFSIILIMIGALIGIFFGFNAIIGIQEGAEYPVVFATRAYTGENEIKERTRFLQLLQMSNGDISILAQRSGVPVSEITSRMKKSGIIPLGFTVRCDDFETEYYGQTDMPKSFLSLLTIIDAGKPVKSQWVQVNKPLKYKGISFYQFNYSLAEDLSQGEAIFEVHSGSGVEQKNARIGESFTLPGSNQTVTVKDFSPALKFDEMGRPFTYNDTMTNPAVQVEVKGPSGPYSIWILKRDPSSGVLPDGTVLKLMDFWGIQITGIQVRKDPGVWVVYAGCLALALGLFLAFFMSHKKVWIRISPVKGGSRVQIAGSVSKNKFAFERKLEKLSGFLSEGGNK